MSKQRFQSTRMSLVATLALAFSWMLLWGAFDFGGLFFGVAVAIVIQLVFPLPDIPALRRFRPWGVVMLTFTTVWDLTRASIEIAVAIVAWWKPVHGVILHEKLFSDDPFIVAATVELVTLVPGSLVVDVYDNELVVHGFDGGTDEKVARIRHEVRLAELRIIRAFGTKDAYEAARERVEAMQA